MPKITKHFKVTVWSSKLKCLPLENNGVTDYAKSCKYSSLPIRSEMTDKKSLERLAIV